MKKHNGTISLLKFIFAIIIMRYHFRVAFVSNKFVLFPINLGYLAVDFFFIVSGYYFGLSAIKDWNKRSNIYLDNLKMLWKKIKKLLPYSIIATIITCIGVYIFRDYSISRLLPSLLGMFFLSSFGIGDNIVGAIWFVSSMLISMAIIYPLLRKLKVNYIYFWAPLIIFFGFGILYRNFSSLNIHEIALNNYINGGLIRALANINIGVILGYVIKNSHLTVKPVKLYIYIITFVEFLLYAFIIFIILFYPKGSHLDYLLILVIVLALTISLSEISYSTKLFSNKFVYYLEQLSMPIMFNHVMVLRIFSEFNFGSIPDILILPGMVLLTITFTIIEYHLLNFIIPKINLKKFLVEK